MHTILRVSRAIVALSGAALSIMPLQAAPTGPHGAVMEYDPGHVPAQTIYRPRDIGNAHAIPIIAWGNGGCKNNGGAASRQFLMELASWGYLLVAAGMPGPDRPVEPTSNAVTHGPTPAIGEAASGESAEPSHAADLVSGLDWAIGENTRKGSIYAGRLAVRKIAVMGRSCGGLQALAVQSDPRIVTSMIWNSGVFPGSRMVGGVLVTKEDLKHIHAPIAYILGGLEDIAHPQGSDDVVRIDQVPLFFGEIPVGHPGTMGQENGGSYARVARAWLDWQLKGDLKASRMFRGPRCGLCIDQAWRVQRKRL